jgi:predicted RNase H-like HicB family nuclease
MSGIPALALRSKRPPNSWFSHLLISRPPAREVKWLRRIFRGEQTYVAECLDPPVVTEAATLDELAINIREAISLHLEGEDLPAMGLSNHPTILATM